ncbi:MAG: hypothetical protein DLM58_09150 [Pseudonocardiales bacterium]|nr:MAG: hypothetical protein DLM58_09150 [Pseudonocardiales bacterium]
MSAARSIRAASAAVLLAAVLSACATTVNGTGRFAGTGVPQSGDFPSPTTGSSSTSALPPSQASTPAPPSNSGTSRPAGTFTCPTIRYPFAHLAFDCIVGGMAVDTKDNIWPLRLYKTVEASTSWVFEEGAGNWGDPGSKSLTDIALAVRTRMITAGGYGTSPTPTTVTDTDTTVGGAPAHVLQTTITLNPAWAKGRGTKVTSEKLWIVVLKVGAKDDSLWYTSIPNLASELWPKVPAIIQSIRGG